jgi:hypothetical protein
MARQDAADGLLDGCDPDPYWIFMLRKRVEDMPRIDHQ